MTAKRAEELTQEFTEWMALGIEHDAHVIAWVQASSSRTLEYLREEAKHAESNRLPHELAFESAWGVWEKVDELKAERQEVESWTVNNKQEKDGREAEIKRIDAAIDLLLEPNGATQTHAPVVAASDATPDPERRLAALRELGGFAKYKNCEWTFTCIGKLVESEKQNGRTRSDVKTIRSDLKEAAQAERDAHSAGLYDGLGQRRNSLFLPP
jgi:hypothetical protein